MTTEKKHNRVIKFRAWDGDKMKYNICLSEVGAYMSPAWGHFPSYPVMQFTGLLDKLGKEIYEGDILKDHSGFKWVVFWHSDHACFGCKSPISTSEIIDNLNMEVIGNIYQDKHLLE